MYICFLQFSEESLHIRSIVIIIKKDSYVNVQTHQGLSFIVSLFPDVEIDMACSVLNCLCVALCIKPLKQIQIDSTAGKLPYLITR